MTIAAQRPVRLTRDEAKVLAHYAAGEAASTICINTGLPLSVVGRVLDEYAGNDRIRARDLVAAYGEQVQAVVAAKGGRPASPQPVPAVPAAVDPAPAPAAAPGAGPTPAVVEAAEQQPVDAGGALLDRVDAGEQQQQPVDALLEQADATGDTRLQRTAARIRDLVGGLRGELADFLREKALRDELTQLEARIAEVKQELRPRRTTPVPAAPAAAAPVSAEVPAVDGAVPVDLKAVRAWAIEHGVPCPKVGRVPRDAVAAYQQAHPGGGAS